MKKIAFVFPGQGAQHVGMAKELVQHYAQCQQTVAIADERLGFALSQLMFEGPEDQLKQTEFAQPALVTTSMVCYQLLVDQGILPSVVAGHSLGEYAALVAAGAIDFSDAVWLVHQRGRYMKEAVPQGNGGMVAVLGLSEQSLEALCAHCSQFGLIEMANFNCPGQIVVSGEQPALDEVLAKAKEYGAKRAIALAVSGPFHSSLLKPAGVKLADAIAQIAIKDAALPVIANISATPVQRKEEIIAALVKQVSSPVRWTQTIEAMVQDGVEIIIEVGSGKVLTGLTKKIAPDIAVFNVEDIPSLEHTVQAVQTMLVEQ